MEDSKNLALEVDGKFYQHSKFLDGDLAPWKLEMEKFTMDIGKADKFVSLIATETAELHNYSDLTANINSLSLVAQTLFQTNYNTRKIKINIDLQT